MGSGQFLAFLLTTVSFGATFDGRQPQMAARGDFVALTYGVGNAVYFAASHDGGRQWSEPMKVAEDGVMSLGMHRGPRVAIAGPVIVISAVAGPKGKGADGDIQTWRSTDGGKTWAAGPRVNDTVSSAREGLHAMAGSPDGLLFAAWLDDRSGRKEVYGAVSNDGGLSWTNRLIYHAEGGSVCECCHPSVLISKDGSVYVMFRNSLAGARDLYLAHSRDRGSSFSISKLGTGTWKLEACPMDGGGLTEDSNGVRTIWRRADTVYEARPGETEREIAKGKNPATAGRWEVWTTADVIFVLGGDRKPKRVDTGAYPILAAAGRGIVLAYERDGKIVTTTLD